MSANVSKNTTLRHFYCRDDLWHAFARMSDDMDRGVDELVNEAMRVFAREKGYLRADQESRPPARPAPAVPKPPPLPPPHRPTPPQLRPSAAMPALPVEASAPPLYLTFEDQRYIIDKEQFIIGRGAKSSDLAIRDGNVSRKHAAVIRRSGAYYIKDLGSTNGIDFNGVRIDNRKIEDGDVFQICDYKLKFTYR